MVPREGAVSVDDDPLNGRQSGESQAALGRYRGHRQLIDDGSLMIRPQTSLDLKKITDRWDGYPSQSLIGCKLGAVPEARAPCRYNVIEDWFRA
jgi:hypothetical protein